MRNFQAFAGLVLGLWLFAETIWDLRQREIPRWFSLIPLVTGLLHLVWVSPWLAAFLMAFSILGTHLIQPSRYLVVAARLFFWLSYPVCCR